MRIAIYVRVSTLRASAEPDHRTTTGAATGALPGPAVGLAGCADLSRVICHSGATLHRPGLEHLRDQVATGGFDQVIITAPDRLARKYVHQMLLIEELEGHGGPGPLLGATHGRGSQ
jgi:site-specific DNA recombinase